MCRHSRYSRHSRQCGAHVHIHVPIQSSSAALQTVPTKSQTRHVIILLLSAPAALVHVVQKHLPPHLRVQVHPSTPCTSLGPRRVVRSRMALYCRGCYPSPHVVGVPRVSQLHGMRPIVLSRLALLDKAQVLFRGSQTSRWGCISAQNIAFATGICAECHDLDSPRVHVEEEATYIKKAVK